MKILIFVTTDMILIIVLVPGFVDPKLSEELASTLFMIVLLPKKKGVVAINKETNYCTYNVSDV